MQGTLPGCLGIPSSLAIWLKKHNLFQNSPIAGDLILNTLPGLFRAGLGMGQAKPAKSKTVATHGEVVAGKDMA